MSGIWERMYRAARSVQNERRISDYVEAGCVAAAVLSAGGTIYTGVCIDTCHAFAAGYDLATPEGYKAAWDEFGDLIGWEYLSAMHINDTKKGLASRVDRHESLGKGMIGSDFFPMLMNDPHMDNIPLILETPDESLWSQEIAWLYSLIK